MGIPISRRVRPDYWGWHYTKTCRYSVKSGYKIEETDSLIEIGTHGPNFWALQAKLWKLNCPSKIKHFIWQNLSGCVAVKRNLTTREIKYDPTCSRCGADEETINHVLFECPPAVQVWALAPISSPIEIFPGNSIWYNLDYLFWRVPDSIEIDIFSWVIWQIWKSRNEYCFMGKDRDSNKVLSQVKQDKVEWLNARSQICYASQPGTLSNAVAWSDVSFPLTVNPTIMGYRCFVDASWKCSDMYSGMGWFCYPDAVSEGSRGARLIRRSLSALHSEVEAVLWAMESLIMAEVLEMEMATDCVDVLKLLMYPEEWPAFQPYQEEFHRLKSLFRAFSLHVIPRSLNHKADALARSIRESAND